MSAKKRIVKTVKKDSVAQVNKDVVLLQISEIKKDSLSNMLTSLTVSMLALLLFIGAPSVFPNIINPYLESSLKIMQVIVIIPVVVFLLVLIVNFVKWIKLIKLAKLLKN